jgi:hypothetical protein
MSEIYYRVKIEKKEKIVFFVAILRSLHDNLLFDRTEKKESLVFECFLTAEGEREFIKIINYLLKKNIIFNYEKRNITESSAFEYKD